MSKDDAWTRVHDLALLYIALAYGTDYDLSDEELSTITNALQGWDESASREDVQEIVVEAMTVFLEEDPEREVVRSMQSLRNALSEDERTRALSQFERIARADGIVLRRERGLISILADVWGVRSFAPHQLDGTSSRAERASWSLMHDMALVCVIFAHSTDNDLSEVEIAAMVDRLAKWQQGLSEDDVRRVLSEALKYYASEPGQDELQRSVYTLGEELPMMQRLALLDDLLHIAQADGELLTEERDMILALSRAWNVTVKLNGQARARA